MRRAGVGAGLVLVLGVCAWGTSGAEQNPPAKPTPGQQKALKTYETVCQPCHGPKGDSPMPMMSLADGEWAHGSSTREIAKTIAEGVPGTAMLPNKDKFTKEEILELARLVRSFDPKLKPEKAPVK